MKLFSKHGGLLIGIFLLFMSCVDSDRKAPTSKSNTVIHNEFRRPSNVALRSLGINELDHYEDYDYYLLYMVHRPWDISCAFSLILKDSILYSYTRYMNNVVSTIYPPVYYQEDDSIYYTVTYREHDIGLLDSIKSITNRVGFYQYDASTPEINPNGSHDSRWLIILSDKGVMYTAFNWLPGNRIEKELVLHIKEHFMRYTESTDSMLGIKDTSVFRTHIPEF